MNDTVLVLSAASAIVAGTPILFAALGEILTERSGVMNLGLEGLMLFGGVAGFWVSYETGNVWLALLVAGIAGALLSLVHALLAITLRVNQIVSGIALVIVGDGLSAFWGSAGEVPFTQRQTGSSLDPILPDFLADLPAVGPVVFGHDAIVYLSWFTVAGASYFLFRTTPGLSVRAVGNDPAAADAAGLSVTMYRYIFTLIGGFGAGFGGGYLILGVLKTWQQSVTAGAGWIAFSLVILAGWRPWRALVAAYLFGVLRTLGFTLQIAGVELPADFLAMIPFIAAYLVMLSVSASPARARRVAAPAALAVPYMRESR